MCWGEDLPPLENLRVMMQGRPTALSSSFRLTYNMLLNVLKTDLAVTSLMQRSYYEFATQRALGGRDVPRLLARGAKRLQALQAEVEAIACIKTDPDVSGGGGRTGKPDVSVVDTTVLDIEDSLTSLGPSWTTGATPPELHRNYPRIAQFHSSASEAQRVHLRYIGRLATNGKLFSQLFCPGRIVVVDSLPAPTDDTTSTSSSALSSGSGSAAAAGSTTTLRFLPAVILGVDTRPKAGAAGGSSASSLMTSAAAAATGTIELDKVDVTLTIAALCPPGYSYSTPLPAEVAPTAPAASASLAAASSHPSAAGGFGGMVMKKKDNDDDLSMMMGGGKGKGKGGGGGGKGGGGGGKGAASSAASAAAASTPSAPAAVVPDRPLSLDSFRRYPTVHNQQQRIVAVVRIPLKSLARLTSLRVGTGPVPVTSLTTAPSSSAASSYGTRLGMIAATSSSSSSSDSPLASAVLGSGSSSGSSVALEALMSQLLEALVAYQADMPVPLPATSSGTPRPDGVFSRAAFRLPPLDPRSDLRPPVSDIDFVEAASAARRAEGTLTSIKCDGCPRFGQQWEAYARLRRVSGMLQSIRQRYSIEALALFPEMQVRFSILRRLGYTRPGADASTSDDNGGEAGFEGDDVSGSSKPTMDVVALKGRVAAEVSTCDELVFTEALFEGVLRPLNPAEMAALLSALVFEDKSTRDADVPLPPVEGEEREAPGPLPAASATPPAGEDADEDADAGGGAVPSTAAAGDDAASTASGVAGATPVASDADDTGTPSESPAEADGSEVAPLGYDGPDVTAIPRTLADACEKLRLIALALGRLQMDAGLDIIPSQFVRQSLNFGLLLPTYAWACGVPFSRICELTDVSEGHVVRTITGLENTCREVRNSARIMGDPLLFRKAEMASLCIKRDVIFASSLYLS